MSAETLAPTLVQVVPAGPGGVRDHAAVLQATWAQCGRPSHVIELSQQAAAAEPLSMKLQRLQARPEQPLSLLLHFSGYGYHPRGLCGWLLPQLQAARESLGPQLRVVVLFHELFASGPPWRSAFWLAGRQAGIARRLAQAADAVLTNTDHHAAWLRRRLPADTLLHVQPVFSNIGEPACVPAPQERRPELIVFGSASTRSRALARLPRHANDLRALGIERVIEVGPPGATPVMPAGMAHHHAGRLPQVELGALLQTVRYGLIDYPSVHLGKSGVFAAYAAQGCVVLNTASPGPDADGLRAGLHYLSLTHPQHRGMPGQSHAFALAAALRTWYLGHTATQQGAEVAALLDGLMRVP